MNAKHLSKFILLKKIILALLVAGVVTILFAALSLTDKAYSSEENYTDDPDITLGVGGTLFKKDSLVCWDGGNDGYFPKDEESFSQTTIFWTEPYDKVLSNFKKNKDVVKANIYFDNYDDQAYRVNIELITSDNLHTKIEYIYGENLLEPNNDLEDPYEDYYWVLDGEIIPKGTPKSITDLTAPHSIKLTNENPAEPDFTIKATSSESNFSVDYVPISLTSTVDDLSTPSTNSFVDTNLTDGKILPNFDVEENWYAMQEGILTYAISDNVAFMEAAMCFFEPLNTIPGKVPVWYNNGKRVGEKWTAFDEGENVFELKYEWSYPVSLNINSKVFPGTGQAFGPTFKYTYKDKNDDSVEYEYDYLSDFYDFPYSTHLFNSSADYFYVVENVFYYGFKDSNGRDVRTILEPDESELWNFVGWSVNGNLIPSQPYDNIFIDNYLFKDYLSPFSPDIQINAVYSAKSSVTGRVTDANNIGLGGVKVLAKTKFFDFPITTYTDDFGYFSLMIMEDVPFDLYFIKDSYITVHADFPFGTFEDMPWQWLNMTKVSTVPTNISAEADEGFSYFDCTYSVDGNIIDNMKLDSLDPVIYAGSNYNVDANGNLVISWISDALEAGNPFFPNAKTEVLTVSAVSKDGYHLEKWLLNGEDLVPGIATGDEEFSFAAKIVSNVNPPVPPQPDPPQPVPPTPVPPTPVDPGTNVPQTVDTASFACTLFAILALCGTCGFVASAKRRKFDK